MKLREVPKGTKFKFVDSPPFKCDKGLASPVYTQGINDQYRELKSDFGVCLLERVDGRQVAAVVAPYWDRLREGHILDLEVALVADGQPSAYSDMPPKPRRKE